MGRVIDTLETYTPFDLDAQNRPGPTSLFATNNGFDVVATRSDIIDMRNRADDSVVAELVESRPNSRRF